MGSSRLAIVVALAGILSLLLPVVLVTPSEAGGTLKRPPQVDLDPDRGMTFGRLPRTSLDWQLFGPAKQALRSHAMDPSVDPYRPTFKPSRYDPATGEIRGSLTDAARRVHMRSKSARESDSESGSARVQSRR